MARIEWKTYLAWAAVPIAIWIGSLFVPLDARAWGKTHWTEPAGAWAILILQALLLTVFNIRVYRHVILGASPDASIVRQIFTGRTWNYIGNGFVMGMKWGFISLLMVIIPALIGFLLESKLAGVLDLKGKENLLFSLVGLLCSYAAFMTFAEQWVLIFPEVSVDGPASFSRLSRYAGYARWNVIKTLALVWCVPYVCGTAIQLAVVLGWNVSWTRHPAAVVLAQSLDIAAGVLSTFVGAVLYKKLSADWPERDSAEALKQVRTPQFRSATGPERTAEEIKQTPPFSPEDGNA